jgi:hypothetical protein
VNPCSDSARKRIATELRHVCPPPLGWRAVVSSVPSLEPFGSTECFAKSRRYVIKVRKEMTEQETVDTLIHEWAHMMSWSAQDDRDHHPLAGEHDAVWGVWYARIYSAYNGVK